MSNEKTAPEWEAGRASAEQPASRAQLVAEFTELRNAQMKRPPTSHTRLWAIYCDYLNDTDGLAAMKTDAELAAAIANYKQR